MSDPLLLAVGVVLGLVIGMLGGGGGILAVPLLVAIGEPVLTASTMSLVVVGTGAAAALVPHQRAGRVDWPVGLAFGALGAAGAVVGARLATVVAPEVVLGGLVVLLVAGAVTMLRAGAHARRHERDLDPHHAASATVARAGDTHVSNGSSQHSHGREAADEPGPLIDAPTLHDPPQPAARPRLLSPRVVTLASLVGLTTGLFGVGAGFVVVPALVAALRLPVKKATATALVVIVMNSIVALVVRHDALADPRPTFELALMTMLFAVLGALLSRRVPSWVLSTAFGLLLVGVAVFTLVKTATLT